MPLGLYLHLPFCRVHCTYCPFVVSTDIGQQESYVDALIREIHGVRRQSRRFPSGGSAGALQTIYFGGGTPSRTSVDALARIVAAIRGTFDVAKDAEFSMEANPEDVTRESLAAWRDLGVNRVSIGVQSFHDPELIPLGRIHGRKRAREAVADGVASGLRTNLDLILGLPYQTAESFDETLDIAIGSGVGHLSLYMLDLEEQTPLAIQVDRGRTTVGDDELVATLYARAVERLGAAGLQQYEISNFARAGEECRHNLRYWSRDPYHGFGVGAHSFLGERRFANTRDIRRYIADPEDAVDFEESLGEGERKREVIFLGLRQVRGINYADLVRLCGQEGIEWADRGLRDGWLRRAGERVAFTPSGFLVSNELISQLF